MTQKAIKEYLASIGRKGGSVKSQAKADAARANGNRPKKIKKNSISRVIS